MSTPGDDPDQPFCFTATTNENGRGAPLKLSPGNSDFRLRDTRRCQPRSVHEDFVGGLITGPLVGGTPTGKMQIGRVHTGCRMSDAG